MKTMRRSKNALSLRRQLSGPEEIAAFHVEECRVFDPVRDHTAYGRKDREVIASGKKAQFRDHDLDCSISARECPKILA